VNWKYYFKKMFLIQSPVKIYKKEYLSLACISGCDHKFVLAMRRVGRVNWNVHFNFSTDWLNKEYVTINIR
jgi:hypothetical protein